MAGRRCVALIAAGGTGDRFGARDGKQIAHLAGLPVLAHTLCAFSRSSMVDSLVVVCHPDRVAEYEREVASHAGSMPIRFVAGGDTRSASVAAGLAVLDDDVEYVLVHDGARPLVTASLIDAVVRRLAEDPGIDGVIVGHPSYDTLKEVREHAILSTLDRSRYWAVQTPQVFRADVLRSAHAVAGPDAPATDDASLVEAAGGALRVFEGPRDNLKITVAEDLAIAEAILAYRGVG